MDFEKILPGIAAALLILGLGYLNPKVLQQKENGIANGHPNYMYLALAALIGAAGFAMIQDTKFYDRL